MPKLLVLIRLTILGCLAGTAYAQVDEVCGKPHLRWKVGDTWAVRTWGPLIYPKTNETPEHIEYMVVPCLWRFEILAERNILVGRESLSRAEYRTIEAGPDKEGAPCFEILAVSYGPKTIRDRVNPEHDRFLIYYRKDSGSLACTAKVRQSAGDHATPQVFRPREALIENETTSEYALFYGAVPFLFPEWHRPEMESRTLHDSRRAADLAEDAARGRRGRVPGRGWNKQLLREGRDEQGRFLECRFQELFQDEEDAGTDKVIVKTEIVTIWRPNEPWWRECRRYEFGTIVGRSELIQIGDVSLEGAFAGGAEPPASTEAPARE